MEKGFQLAESERYRFCAPVEVRWMDSQGQLGSASGTSVDVSVYGLGIMIPVPLPVGTEVTIVLHGIETCGRAQVRHSQPGPSGFRVGLQLELTLFMQNIPGLDEILIQSLRCLNEAKSASRFPTFLQIGLRLARVALQKRQRQEPLLETVTR